MDLGVNVRRFRTFLTKSKQLQLNLLNPQGLVEFHQEGRLHKHGLSQSIYDVALRGPPDDVRAAARRATRARHYERGGLLVCVRRTIEKLSQLALTLSPA